MKLYDAIIIGAGPAGLSAALWLGRSRRHTLVFDSARPRNAASRGLHGFLTRDGATPEQLRELGRKDAAAYSTVEFRDTRVVDAGRNGGNFDVVDESGAVASAKLLLLATGRIDHVPEKPGFRDFFGRGVYHCPYCDGWEHRGQPMAVYGSGQAAMDMSLLLATWTDTIAICVDDTREGGIPNRSGLEAQGIRIVTERIARLEGVPNGLLNEIHFESRAPLPCSALFFCSNVSQKSSLPERLGCEFDADGSVICKHHAARNQAGLFVAGNVRGGVHLAIVAAAEGAEAALAMNEALLEMDQTHSGRELGSA